MNNVLLTGGMGYIGSHTALKLSQNGNKVYLYDNLSNSQALTIQKINSLTKNDVVFINGDVRDTKFLSVIIEDNKINSVIHFSGLKAVGESSIDPLRYYSNNVQGTISLLQAMQNCGLKKIIFSSSATVYGKPKYLPIDEKHALSANNPYGRSKLQTEEILHDICTSDQSFSVLSLRYFNPIGAHTSGLIGETPNGVPNNLMPYLVQVAAKERAELNIFGNDYETIDGTGVRDYIHVEDVALGHLYALNHINNHIGFDVLNLGTGRGTSVLDLVKSFEKANSVQIPLKIVSRRIGDVAQCYADVDKAKKLLSWEATHTLESMCKSSWNFYKNQYQISH